MYGSKHSNSLSINFLQYANCLFWKGYMKNIFKVALLFTITFFLNIFDNILIAKNLRVITENPSVLRLEYQPNLLKLDTIKTNNELWIVPVFDEPTYCFRLQDGTFIFTISKLIALPNSKSYRTSYSSSSEYQKLFIPQLLKTDIDSLPMELTTNDIFLSTSLNDIWSFIQYLGIGRNLHLGNLHFIVAKFSPETSTLVIPKKIETEIQFELTSRIANSKLIHNVINTKQAKNWLLDYPAMQREYKFSESLLSSNRKMVKIKIEKEGIYKIDASMLASLGISITSHLVSTLKLFGSDGKTLREPPFEPQNIGLNEIPIIVRTKPNGELDYILFYAVGTQGFEFKNGQFRSYKNPYSNYNYYLLAWGGSEGQRIISAEEPNECPQPKIPQFYIERIAYREEITNPFNSGSGNIWFGASIFPRYFTNQLPDLYRDSDIEYRFYVAQNYTDVNQNLFGQFTFYEGQYKLGEVFLPRCISYEEAKAKEYECKLTANQIPSDNRSYLRIDYQSPLGATGNATPYFNWYEIHYPRLFKAIDKAIGFFTSPNSNGCYEYQISGFDNEAIGLEVTNPTTPKLLVNRSVVLNTFTFRTNLDSTQVKRFFISSVFLKPEIETIELAGLSTTPLNSEVVVITHKLLLNSANKYKEFRQSTTNYNISVVNIEDIYNEYSYGIPDPMAIRYFLIDAFKKWQIKPFYVVLWGDGHYDFRNISTRKINYIPAYQFADNYESFNSTVSYTSDDFYGFLVGNDWVIDVVVSRVPIYDDQTGLNYVEKLRIYETSYKASKWSSTALFCADDSPQSKGAYDGKQHTQDSETITNYYLPKDIIVKKIYLPEYPTENIPGGRRKPLATSDLVRTINDGVILVNWLGHGNPRVWAHEELFNRDQTISLLSNKDKLFLGIAATCDFGRFDMPETKSGTEELLFYRKGGAIAFFSATRAVFTTENRIFNQNIISEIFNRNSDGNYQTIGEAYFHTKQVSISDNHRKYNIFGDPLITLKIPNKIVKLDKVNKIDLNEVKKDTLLPIMAYSLLSLEGSIIMPKDSSLVSNFNGVIEIMINDVGFTKVVTDIDGTKHYIYKDGGIIAKGFSRVTNGKFSSEFFITDEVSFLNGNITIRMLAFDTTNNIFAKGLENRLKIAGIDTLSTFTDNEPPVISIFIDDTTFKPGDIVSNPPTLIVKLYDNTAINTTGVGIGHLIEAWVDEDQESINLTNDFESLVDSPKEGLIIKVLPKLASGSHTVKVRAWDIFNNYSIATTKFSIVDTSAGIFLMNPIVKPNPTTNNVTFRIQHNINEPYEVVLEIFNIFGQKVFEKSEDFSKLMNFEIRYDCIDQFGNSLPTGVYIYSIKAKTGNKNASICGKFAIVK